MFVASRIISTVSSTIYLASSACAVSPSRWLSISGLLSDWVTQPFLLLPVFFLVFQLLRKIPRRYGRRPLQMLVFASALTYLMALFPPTVRLAETVLINRIPQDSGQLADAIVVLGRGDQLTPSRVEVAAQLWEEHRAPFVFASGSWDAPRMIRRLRGKGIPDQFLSGEGCSRTTYENALFTAEALKSTGVKRILLVTDAPHMLRSLLTFEKFGFAVTPAPSTTPADLTRTSRARLVLREYAGLVSYQLMGRFSGKDLPKLDLLTEADSKRQSL